MLDDHPSDAERLLLESVRVDVPPTSSKRRMFAALGLAAATTTTASAGGASASSALAISLMKWVAVGAVSGAVAFEAREQFDRTTRPPLGRTASTSIAPPDLHEVKPNLAPSREELPMPSEPTSLEPPVSADEVTPPPVRSTSTKVATVLPDPPSPAQIERQAVPAPRAAAPLQTLGDEVATLDGARRALASGDAEGALSMLGSYDGHFAQPVLRPEADLLRIEVLLALGHTDSARHLAGQLLIEQPDSAYAQRVRSLLARTVAADQ
jgi:hypothetical protein